MFIYIPTILAVVAIVARYVRVLEPLHSWLPARWRWLPSAALAVAGHIAQQLPGAIDAPGMVEVFLGAAVIAALAAAAGLHAPETQQAPKQPSPLSKVTPTSLLFLAVSPLLLLVPLGLTGCAPSLQVSRSQGLEARRLGASSASSDQCRRLEKQEIALRRLGEASCILSAPVGLTSIPIEDVNARRALITTAAGFGVVCAALQADRAIVAARREELCQ